MLPIILTCNVLINIKFRDLDFTLDQCIKGQDWGVCLVNVLEAWLLSGPSGPRGLDSLEAKSINSLQFEL